MAEEIVKRDPNAGIETAPEGMLSSFEADAGKGLEGVAPEDFAVPLLNIVQALSPQRAKSEEKYIPGAEEGHIFNSVTSELFPEGIRVIPAFFRKVYMEWKPRDTGGGLVRIYDSKAEGLENVKEGNVLSETANHYVLFEDTHGFWRPAIVSCSSTKLSASRMWNTRQSMLLIRREDGTTFNPPSFSRVYLYSTVSKKNDKGTFFVPKFDAMEWVTPELYQQALDFRTAVEGNRVEAKFELGADSTDPAF